MSRQTLSAAALTVEYDTVRGDDAIALLPFPSPGDDDGILLYGSIEDLRAVVDSMDRLLDDLVESA